MPHSILVLPDHSRQKNKYLMCLKLGRVSLLWPSGRVCKLGGTPLPVIGETEVKLMDADALPVLVTKYFPHELLIGSDAISRGNGKIDYGTRKVTSFGQNFSKYAIYRLHPPYSLCLRAVATLPSMTS